MKTRSTVLGLALASVLSWGMLPAAADLEVSASVQIHATADFYAPLTPNGVWVEVGSYGRCWHPAHVAVGWSPYCVGHWVWTDCGWYWASDEPWAWACYHYGWWTFDAGYGWVWVPGIEWAPAWVSWRVGGGYIGWAPWGPHGVVVAPAAFVFVDAHRFREPVRPTTVIVNNTTIINKTTPLTTIKRETRTFEAGRPQTVVVNEGPGVDLVKKSTGREVSAVPIREAARQTPVPAGLAQHSTGSRPEKAPAAVPGQAAPSATHRTVPEPTPAAPPVMGHPGRSGPPSHHQTAPGREQPPAPGPNHPDHAPAPDPNHPPAAGPNQPPAPGTPSGKPQPHPKWKDVDRGHRGEES